VSNPITFSKRERCELPQSLPPIGHALVHARMRASLAELDQGELSEGHELPSKWKVAKQMVVVGRRLSQEEAKRLLAKFA